MEEWQTFDTAPKDGSVFEAWYESSFGPPFGPMRWFLEVKEPYFLSYAMMTETKKAKYWRRVTPPNVQVGNR